MDYQDVYARMFASRLRAAIGRSGLSIAEIVRRSGVADVAIYSWMGLRRRPRLLSAVMVADALGVSLDWLLGRDYEPGDAA